jgi:tetratricopeptide (TPR) repeat protein
VSNLESATPAWVEASLGQLRRTLGSLPNVADLIRWSEPHGQVVLTRGDLLDGLLANGLHLASHAEGRIALLHETEREVRTDRHLGLGLAWILAEAMPEYAPARTLLARALLNYNQASASMHLGYALSTMPDDLPTRHRYQVEALLAVRVAYLRDYGRRFPYREVDPMTADQYHKVAFDEVDQTLLDLDGPRENLFDGVILKAMADGDRAAEAAARRMHGETLAHAGHYTDAVQAYIDASEVAERYAVTTEIGHIRRDLGNVLIHEGLRRRGQGDGGIAAETFERAALELQQAAEFESQPGCEYWAALSHARCADAYRHLGQVRMSLLEYAAAREALHVHLRGQRLPSDRAVQRQIFSWSAASAMESAYDAGVGQELLDQMVVDGSPIVAELMGELDAMRRLGPRMRRSFAAVRGTFHRELADARAGSDVYRDAMMREYPARARYYAGTLWMEHAPQRSIRDLTARAVASVPDRRVVIVFDFLQHRTFAVRFARDLAQQRVADTRDVSGEIVSDIYSKVEDALQIAKDHPAGATIVRRAVGAMVTRLQAAAGELVTEMVEGIDAKRVVLLAYRGAGGLPWHAIEVDGRPLLEHVEIVYAHDVDAMARLQRRPSFDAGAASVTMVYDERGAPAFDVLARRCRELSVTNVVRNPTARQLAEIAPPVHAHDREAPDAYQGAGFEDALLGRVLVPFDLGPIFTDASTESAEAEPDGDRGPARDLFFACHGAFEPEKPFASYLMFRSEAGEDRRFTFADALSSMDLSTWRSVVFGACESGRARRDLPSEEASLGSAFLAAGVDYVVSALWPVNQVATVMLLEWYFREIALGRDIPTALRAAQLRLRAYTGTEVDDWAHSLRDPLLADAAHELAQTSPHPFSHPYYWAGFIVTGRP